MSKKSFFFMLLFFPFFALYGQPVDKNADIFRHPFYVGAIGGYGSTTWGALVPSTANQNEATRLSTPVSVTEGGGVVGAFAGYEISRFFAIEAGYMHYPDATVFFDTESLFTYLHEDNPTEFNSQTEAISVMAKIMLLIPDTNIRLFSSFGGANVHRKDILNNYWHVSPTFGAGINYRFTRDVMGEFGGNYTAGFGESNLNPTESYFPFLYSINFRLAYCF